jgi:predicted MPP superfamily phosphohydrolase
MSWLDLGKRLAAFWQNKEVRTKVLGGIGMVAGLGAGVAGYAFWREPLHVRMDKLTVYLPNTKGNLPAEGLRLLHLSDTHFRGANWREHRKIDCVRRACAGLEYDLLIHTGDFLHEDRGLPNVLTLLDAIPAPRLGAYAVFGNHDYSVYSHNEMLPRAWARFQELQGRGQANGLHGKDLSAKSANGSIKGAIDNSSAKIHPDAHEKSAALESGSSVVTTESYNFTYAQYADVRPTPFTHARRLYQFGQYIANAPLDLKRTGRNNITALEATLTGRQIQTLHNRYVHLVHPDIGLDIYLAGVDDVVEGTPELNHALNEIPYDAPTILLSHNPDILTEPGIEQADLVLSGHTHGGQVVLPWLGAAHTQTNHLNRKEVSGYLCRGKTQVYITRGIGEGIPFRLGAAPQITLITILPA